MWKAVKVKVEPLTPEAFAPFGHVIRSFDERQPEVAKGGLGTNEYEVRAAQGEEVDGSKVFETAFGRECIRLSDYRVD